jgi:hypothetical protein
MKLFRIKKVEEPMVQRWDTIVNLVSNGTNSKK